MRLWPLSRRNRPKQFIKFDGRQSLLGATIARALALSPELTIVTALSLKELTKGEVPTGAEASFLLEPIGRHTAPAAGLAALSYQIAGQDPVLLILPADHHITDEAGFNKTMRAAAATAARENALVCIGKPAVTPETGFGYIRAEADGRISHFQEKPPYEKAMEFVKSGNYRWNLGIFAARASVLLAEIKNRQPEVHAVLEEIKAASQLGRINEHAVTKLFPKMPSISIDNGLMENNDHAYTVASQFGWNDVGSWQGVYEISQKDENGNAVIGDVLHTGCKNCLLVSEHGLLAVHGLTGMAAVKTADSTLTCPLEQSQAVREITTALTKNNRAEIDFPFNGDKA